MNECLEFGAFVKTKRLANGITAREASQAAGILPSNFSKLEHGVLRPPSDVERQKKLAAAIGLEFGTENANQFFDLAGKANKAIPADLAEIISEDGARPLLLRTIGNKRLTEDEIRQLIEIVRGLRGANQEV